MVLANWHNSLVSLWVEMSLQLYTLSWPVSVLTPECCMLTGKAANTNIIVFGFDPIRAWTHDLPHSSRAEHDIHYTTNLVQNLKSISQCIHDLKKIITLMLMISHMTVLWINEHLLIWYSWICEWKKADMAFSSEKIKRTAYLQFHTQNTNKQEVFRAM
jgi:hypothetical protein